jgi:NADPH:quinone reductase-like Zn-dependent oxidoreductase
MHAWQVHQWSEPEALEWAEIEVPEPGPGQVRVRNRAAALNFFDILQIQGSTEEVGRMLSGHTLTPAALRNAAELIRAARA